MALSGKQLLFVDYYMEDPNQTTAYQRAYGCEEATARVNASRLLTNANILAEVELRRKKMQEDSGMTVRWILEKYKTIIDNTILNDPNVAKGALDSVGKHYGMFNDKSKVDVVVTHTYEEQLNNLMGGTHASTPSVTTQH